MAFGSECKSVIASAGIAVAQAPRVAQTRDRPRWWLGTRCVLLRSSGHSAARDVSDSHGYYKVRQNHNRARCRILCNVAPYRYTCNIVILELIMIQNYIS